MTHWMKLAAALWLVMTPMIPRAADARVLGPNDFLQPLIDISAKPLGPDEGVVVIGYAVRGARAGTYGEWPTHIGWMPFADDTGAWTGKPMAISSERCSRGSSLACTKIQYRVYRLPAGGYSLAWVFHDKPYALAKIETKGESVRYDVNMRELNRVEFPDVASTALGAPAFRVIPGHANYAGDILVQLRDGQGPRIAWASRNEGEVGAMMRAAGYENLLNFQGARYGTGR